VNDDDAKRMAAVLEELREGQKLQLERQLEALDLQRKQFELVQGQAARTERIQDKAEQIQDRSARLVQVSRRLALFLLPVIIVIVLYVSWLVFRLARW
jgi:uncharacterized membrane protein (DUF106 family)